MSRMHHGDWSLEVVRGYQGHPFIIGETCYLSARVTLAQADRLIGMQSARGFITFRHRLADSMLYAENIKVTPAEVEEIRRGAHPLDVLFGWAGLGYRLVAVEDDWSLR